MINVAIVMIQAPYGGRWIDGIYLVHETAEKRVEQLKAMWSKCGQEPKPNGMWAWIIEASVEDAALADKPTANKTKG